VSIRLPSDNTRDFRCPECKTKYNSNGNLIIEDDVDIYKYDETSSNNEESSTVPLETSTEIPEDFKYNEEFKKYFEEMENTSNNIFITGKAGTGKSTLLQYFKENSQKKYVALAPTGVAAIKIKGETLHSFFLLPPKTPILKKNIKRLRSSRFGGRKEIVKSLETIVIDEASMVRADILDAIDYSLRINRSKMKIPFGGVQIILFGDLYQLPPVITSEEIGEFQKEYKGVGDSGYFFQLKYCKKRKN
jgi:DNA replication protein DnaC